MPSTNWRRGDGESYGSRQNLDPLRDLGSGSTLRVAGLLFRFVHWRDNRQVHVASERLPDEWHELSGARVSGRVSDPLPVVGC